MAERTVTLNIKVKDGEVKQAEASMNRLQKAADNVGTPGASGNSSQQEKLLRWVEQYGSKSQKAAHGINVLDDAIEGVAAASSKATPAAAGSAEAIAGIGSAAGPVAIAIGVVVVAIAALIKGTIELGQYIFKLTENFADYANEIGDVSRETGLAAQTISALKREAASAGQSFGSIEAAVNKFRETVGKAAAGSESARASLKAIGVDASTASSDIDRAFKSAVRSIAEMPPGLDQARAAFNLFGADGYKLIPFLKGFNGNIDELITDSQRLGMVISGENVVAAREFRRAFKDVQDQVTGVKNAFGSEFLPVVTDALKSFGGWLQQNKSTITDWASWTADKLDWLIQKLYALRQAGADFDQWVRERVPGGTYLAGPAPSPYANMPPRPVNQSVQNEVQTRIPGLEYNPDPGALAAARAEQMRLQQEIVATAKRDFDALIQNWSLYATGLQNQFKEVFNMIKGDLAKTGDIEQFRQNVETAVNSYVASIAQADDRLKELEDERARRDKVTANERELLTRQQNERNRTFAKTYTDIQAEAGEIVNKITKKQSDDNLGLLEAEMRRAIELKRSGNAILVAEEGQSLNLRLESESQYVATVNRLETELLEFKKTKLQEHLEAVRGNAEKEASITHELALLDDQIAQQKITNENRVLEVKKKAQEKENERIKAYRDYRQALLDELETVTRVNRPLTVYEQTVRNLSRNYQDFTKEEQANLLVLAAQIDAVEELNRRHEELKAFFAESLSYAFDGDIKGLVENFGRRIKDTFVDRISDILATKVLGFDPNQTDNPVAKPIVKTLDQTNSILKGIAAAVGAPISGSGFGSLGTLFGGSAGGGIFNFGGVSSGFGTGITPGREMPGWWQNTPGTGSQGGAGGGGMWDQLKQLFSTGQGGLFAKRGGSSLAGYMGGIGDLAVMAGGMIGGRAGGILSMAGTGASFGAMFGPWGAAIGAGIGALFGLFGGDPNRKEDKRVNIPNLNKGFADALKQLNEILAGVRSMSIDPDEAVSRANEVRAEIAAGFGIEFKSKKYRKQAKQMITAKLGEADNIIEQIKQAAEIARGAADRSKRILPEFAGGHYFADFFRPNGLVPGAFDGADNILAMISRGEMVLNPHQQNRVRALAGHDVFAHAGIPNYPKASTSPKLAGGGIAGTGLTVASGVQPVFAPNFTIYMSGVTFTDQAKAWVESDDGKRTFVRLMNDRDKGKL